MYVYIESEPNVWTTGHYHPLNHKWIPESDYNSEEEAAARCHWLNGGNTPWNMMIEVMEDIKRGEGEPEEEDDEGEEWKDDILSIEEQDLEYDKEVRKEHIVQARAIKSGRIVFEDKVYYSQDAAGSILSAQIQSDVDGCAPEMFVVLRSADLRGQHMQARKLEGKKVRVIVEVIDE